MPARKDLKQPSGKNKMMEILGLSDLQAGFYSTQKRNMREMNWNC